MKRLIDCAMKREKCDLTIKNIKIFNVFTGETEEGELAVAEGRIVGVGRGYESERVYDGGGRIALPAFLDAHIHVESSMLSPEAFASLAVAHGTSAIVADPHEIVNVCGIAGAEYVREAFRRLDCNGVCPLEVYLQLPSCVPATPFETSGASIGGKETEDEIKRDLFFGLGEMMNFPAVLAGEEDVLRKLAAAHASGKPVDGHAPGVSGDGLNAYRCAGILTDHESLTAEECREKAARGIYVQIRCGSSVNNIADAKDAIDPYNFRRFVLCSDDKNAKDLSSRGHIDDALRRLVAAGLDAKYAVALATLNVAECYGIADTGALAPRYFADVVLVDDLKEFGVCAVFHRGVLVAENGKALFATDRRYLPQEVGSTVRVKKVSAQDFRIVGHGGQFRVMEIAPHGLYTGESFVPAPVGEFSARDFGLCKLAVVERHFASGNIGLGLVKGYGLTGGAIGISVAHDSHNLVIMGDDDEAMARVVALLEEAGGGMALVCGEEEDAFPLDIAGLMSSAPAETVIARTDEIAERARRMGVKDCYEPFMTMVFLSLAVIPKLKLTDRGLFDLEKYAFSPLEEKKIVAATANPNKLREFREILRDWEIVPAAEAGFHGEVEETGETFLENALLKARAVAEATGLPALADDSGLCVEALGGAPGVYSARYAALNGAADNRALLLERMKDVTDRRARFECAIALVYPDGTTVTAEGRTYGQILRECRGVGGFGYDPLFLSDDLHVTFAEADAELKNSVSHRGRALKALREKL